ncbi:hypothetical protein EC9_15980 [Rosistilla ulvae]|uniref:Uncharacterized protein n=1 Tax=Rosistilla ulvae TaxID=1930277 RepID=A0A517LXS8_9BACT|nr:hypothetical protein [Rosistilla ulvae]QDS87420.1 hypothetical protein EC9_15980 [Rosistilla ulvae]
MAKEKSGMWAELRDGCAAVREVAIVGAIVLLLVAPTSFHSILERAGISSVAGLEFDVDAIEEANQQTSDAASEVDYVKEQLAVLQQQISEQAARSQSPAMHGLARTVNGLEQRLDHAKTSLGQAAVGVHDSVPARHRGMLTPPDELFKRSSPEEKTSQLPQALPQLVTPASQTR